MIDNPDEQLQRVANRLRKVVEDYSTQVMIIEKNSNDDGNISSFSVNSNRLLFGVINYFL